MDKLINEDNSHDRNVIKNNYKIAAWTLAWGVTIVLPRKSIFFDWYSSSSLSVIAICLHLTSCIGLFFILKRYANELDEMWRKAYIDAAAFAALIVWLAANLYTMLEMSSFISAPEIGSTSSFIYITIAVPFLLGLVIGSRHG